MGFEFRLANRDDDIALKALMKNIRMSGDISLSFEREPSYFIAEKFGNLKTETMLITDEESNHIVGVASRSTRYAYIDGIKRKIGYLSNLRGEEGVRNSTLLARGYKFLKKLHRDREVDFYLSTIFSDNKIAQKILTSQRVGLPIYEDIGEFITGFIPLTIAPQSVSEKVIKYSDSSYSMKDIVAFVNGYNARFQYAPFYDVDDFMKKNGIEDFYLYLDDGKIVGLIGAWNQTDYKQVKIVAYSKLYHILRPMYNLFAIMTKVPKLPPTGSFIKNIYGAFVAIDGDNRYVFEMLVGAIQLDWLKKGYAYLAIGFHTNHPLRKTLFKLSSKKLKSRGYLVYWRGEIKEITLPKKDMIPHIEIATL